MTAYSLDQFEPEYGVLLPTDTIALTPDEVSWAKTQSQSASGTDNPWQIYINALARIGLQHWLEQRSPDLLTGLTQLMSVEQLCEITLGEYRLYLIATDIIDDAEIPISANITSTRFNPHFYVLVEVYEEIQQVRVGGYLSPAQLIESLEPSTVQSAESERSLSWLAIDAFDFNLDRLLLCLTCVEPEAIEVNTSAAVDNSISSTVAAAAINVGRWLQDQVDQVAQELAWILLPPIPALRTGLSLTEPFLSTSGELRPLQSPTEEFNRLISDLIRNARLVIPPEARGAYRDWQWETLNLRLYVATWELPLAGSPSDWALLLVLGAQPGSSLPLGLRLQVCDETQILEEPVLADNSSVYLYAQVTGARDERFWVTLSLPNGAAMTLPPFTFSAD